MIAPVTVVGSGASGVHFALSVLRKGGRVRMLDVGRQGRPAVLPDADLAGLKDRLEDPAAYFLGDRQQAVLLPGASEEYYGLPPGKDFVFDPPPRFGHQSDGFAPLFSFARGGLGEAWTAGCYPLTAEETADFPFAYGDLARQYDEVARRIGVTGVEDDLARFMPVHAGMLEALRLDAHSSLLLATYERQRERLNARGVFVGRTRVAALSRALGARPACTYCGRCLWGCPTGALYTPSLTLGECMAYRTFEYVPGVEVTHLRLGPGGRVRGLSARMADRGGVCEFDADRVALAAGTLLSTRIFLETMRREGSGRIRLGGLMDNRQLLVPFVNLRMLGRPFESGAYQYHLLGMGLEAGSPRDYVHGQITTLKTALVHPLIQRLPFDLASATRIFRGLHAALGLVNVNFRDTRRADSCVELAGETESRLRIRYVPEPGEPQRLRRELARVKRALLALDCLVPPGMVHRRPMGASVHYAGTLPMTRDPAPHTTTPEGESRDVGGLFFVDGATFPFLPAKNITFTLMANAARIAEAAF